MNTVNILTLKNQLSAFLARVAKGEVIEVYKHSELVAVLYPPKKKKVNKTKLGLFKSSGTINGEITGPILDSTEWGSLYP